MSFLAFPPNFLWGTATAAHQVEGRNFNNDWWDWEQTPGHIKNGDTSRVACAWWDGRYREDFDRAKALGNNAHRLSLEWSRIEPRAGEWDANAIRFYGEMLEALRERGLTPFVTLHHFTTPRWLTAQRGWENPATIQRFERYADKVAREFGELCSNWITLNEPAVYAREGYLESVWPPSKKDIRAAFRVMAQMVRAHAAAYHAIKNVQPHAQIGLAHHLRAFNPRRPESAADRLIVQMFDYLLNQMIVSAVEDGRMRFPLGWGETLSEARRTQDFVGVNYYYSEHTSFDATRPAGLFRRAHFQPWIEEWQEKLDWFGLGNPDPEAFYRILLGLERYNKPIYIAENGVFDDAGDLQPRYLVSHLAALQRALQAGVDVRGYFWWTLVDNFEWAEGFNLRFGLYRLDVTTQTRAPRPVAAVYARISRENGIAADLLERYGRTD